jgi:hypothetical protein
MPRSGAQPAQNELDQSSGGGENGNERGHDLDSHTSATRETIFCDHTSPCSTD